MLEFIAHSLILSGIVIGVSSLLGLYLLAKAARGFYRWFTRPDY